jgi:hypothetical protein
MNIKTLINEATINDILIAQAQGKLTENQLQNIISFHTSKVLEQYKIDLSSEIQSLSNLYEISNEQIKVCEQIEKLEDSEAYKTGYNLAINYAKGKIDYLIENITFLKLHNWKD